MSRFTIFACPKPFTGRMDVVQRNAILSWKRISPQPKILLFGDDEGTAEVCRELGLRHVPDIARNSYGTPLLDDIFKKAQQMAETDLVCYTNADMIFTSGFSQALKQIDDFRGPFLLSGGRWGLDVEKPLNFSDPHWEEELKIGAQRDGSFHFWGNDYFLFTRGLYPGMPPLAIGRGWFDGWLITKALSQGTPVIDASEVIFMVHQNHDYAHARAENYPAMCQKEESKRNYELAEVSKGWVLLSCATHVLTPGGVKKARVWWRKIFFEFQLTRLYQGTAGRIKFLRQIIKGSPAGCSS